MQNFKISEIANSELFDQFQGKVELYNQGYSILCLFDLDKTPGDQTNHTENSIKVLE